MDTKILHIIARMNVGGTAKYVGNLVENIPQSMLATGFVQGGEIEDSVIDKVPTIRLSHMGRKISISNDFRTWLELRKLVNEITPEIIHTHTFKAGLIGRLIRGKHKHVHTFHGHLLNDDSFSIFERKIIIFIEKFLAKRTDILIAVGDKIGAELRAEGIGLKTKWLSIAPGIDPPNLIQKSKAREQLGISNNNFLVGWMARMVEVKDPYLLLEVAAHLPSVSFIMAGGGGMLEEIKAAAPGNVEVIGWVESNKFWSAVDCGISTSLSEGIPISLLEAQFSALPIIATDVGSTSKAVQNGISGILTTRTVADLVKAINLIIDNPHLRITMGSAGKKFAEENFSIKKMVDSHLQLYDTIFSKND
jgi:glycosyltransferase involved in cell wall biosynthesis